VIVEDRGGCKNRVSVKIEKGVLKVKINTHGCCDVRIRLPQKNYNMSLSFSDATLKLENLTVNNFVLIASASSIKILETVIANANFTITASSIELYGSSIEDRLTISASESSAKLILLNKSALVILQRAMASSILDLCQKDQKPTIVISALASSIKVICMRAR